MKVLKNPDDDDNNNNTNNSNSKTWPNGGFLNCEILNVVSAIKLVRTICTLLEINEWLFDYYIMTMYAKLIVRIHYLR